MNRLKEILRKLYEKNEGDLVADIGFKRRFMNVVNLCLLVYSLVIGLHCLLNELDVLSFINLILSLIFVSYFIATNIFSKLFIFNFIDNSCIFICFLVAYINGNILGFGDTLLILYPFVALVLHGRRMGIIISAVQIVCFAVISLLFNLGVINPGNYYTYQEAGMVVLVQVACIFVYFVVIRWMTALIYDRNIEIYQLNKDLKTKDEIIGTLTNQLTTPLNDISTEAQRLLHNQSDAQQAEQIANIKASTENVLNKINAAKNASQFNIRPVEDEDVVFNAYTLLSNIIKLYPAKQADKQHSVIISPELPRNLQGNSSLTRQILLDIFDSLERKVGLGNSTVKLIVSLDDVTSTGISLNYCIRTEAEYTVDKRNLASLDAQLTQDFDLGMAMRMVQTTGGEFKVDNEEGMIEVHYTQVYKNADRKSQDDPDILSVSKKKKIFIAQRAVKMKDATVLVVDDNEMNQKIIVMYIKDRVKKVVTALSGRSALEIYENTKIDLVLMDLQMPDMDGYTTAIKMREMESGIGQRVPIIAVTAYAFPENETKCLESGMDGFIRKPFKAEELWNLMGEKLEE